MGRAAVLLIGGADSSGGAGVTRDAQVLADFHIDAAVAITAVTAQTDALVRSVHHLPPQLILEQIRCALESRPIAAIKIGMLGGEATITAVLQALPPAHSIPLVLDPVLLSSSGHTLLDATALDTLRGALLPHATLLTPNLPEAAALLGVPAAGDDSAMLLQAQSLCHLGPRAVLLKGGHGSGTQSVDLLMCNHGSVERLAGPRLPVAMRGTGCMLASAIAAGFARQLSLLQACQQAKLYVGNRLRSAMTP